MWWYPLIDAVIVVGGSLAVLVTILRNIPWLLIALALGAAFWFYGPVEAMLGPALKPMTTPARVARRDPPPAPPVTYTAPPAPAPVDTAPPVYAYTAPTVYAGRTVMLFPRAFGGHAFGGHRR